MINHVWTVACSRAVIDAESNNMSLQNVIEQINIVEELQPDGMVNIPFEIVTLWARAEPDVPGRGKSRITFLSPSGKALGSTASEVDLSKHERSRARLKFQGIPIREPGRYIFRVELQDEGAWHQVAIIPLQVVYGAPANDVKS